MARQRSGIQEHDTVAGVIKAVGTFAPCVEWQRGFRFPKKTGRRNFAPTGVVFSQETAFSLIRALHACLQTVQEDRAIRINIADLIRRNIRG